MELKESKLEKLIKDVVYISTGERVELRLKDDILITPVLKKGSVILGIFWANVLQHEHNFPHSHFKYTKRFDDEMGEETLRVAVTHVTFTVLLKTGTVRISSDYVYAWFTRHFRELLYNFDRALVASWVYCPTEHETTRGCTTPPPLDDPNTPTEDYLLFRNRVTTTGAVPEVDQQLARELEQLRQSTNASAVRIKDIDEQDYLSEALLSERLAAMTEGGVFSSAEVHKLFMSLLLRRLATPNTTIYISTPKIDSTLLSEVVDLFLSIDGAPRAAIAAIYTDLLCDPDACLSSMEVKVVALKKYDPRNHAYIEYHVLRKMCHLAAPLLNGCFLAVVHDVKAEVLMTSAHLLSKHLMEHPGKRETAIFVKMEEKEFKSKYIDPCAGPAVAVTY